MISAEERNYYRDIHSINKTLSNINITLRDIARNLYELAGNSNPFNLPDGEIAEKVPESSRENPEV